MSIFDGFPLMNAYSVNLDWVIKKIREVEEYVKNYTAVNNVAYAGIWDITEQYPRWALVTFNDSVYLAKQPVPAGVPLTNNDYWILLADIDPRISGIIQKLADIDKSISGINATLAMLPTSVNSKLLTVNKNGGAMYTSISEAVEDAKKIASKTDRVTICIFRGIYDAQITLLNNPGIDIVGIGDVIINNVRDYPYSTLFTSGDGFFKNIRFNSYGHNTYALHIEAQSDATQGKIVFEGCTFDADQIAGVGIGFGGGFFVEFRECNILTSAKSSVAAYLHNLPQGNTTLAQCLFRGCSIYNNAGGDCILVENARAIHSGDGLSSLALIFQANSIRNGVVKYKNGSETLNYIPQTGEIFAQGTGNTADVNYVNQIAWFNIYPVTSGGFLSFTVPGVKDYYQIVSAQALNSETSQVIEGANFSKTGSTVTVTGLSSVAGKNVNVSILFNRP